MVRDDEEWRGIIVSPEYYWMTDIPLAIIVLFALGILYGVYRLFMFILGILGTFFSIIIISIVILTVVLVTLGARKRSQKLHEKNLERFKNRPRGHHLPLVLSLKDEGDRYFKMGNYQDAINSYTESVKLDPHFLQAWNNMALSYVKLGKKDVARQIQNHITIVKKLRESGDIPTE